MIRGALFLGLAAHIAVAVWNGFFGPSFGAEGDALAFHYEALYYARNLGQFEYITGWIYSYFLGVMYALFSDHIFFGSMLSVLAWFAGALIMVQISRILNLGDSQTTMILLIFSFWPSALLNTSVTLREAYQSLGIACIMYFSLSFLNNYRAKWAYLLFGISLSSILHGALLAFSISMLFINLYFSMRYKYHAGALSSIIVMLFFASLCAVPLMFLVNSVAYNIDIGLAGAVQSYNEGAISINARADYRQDINLSQTLDLVTFAPLAFFQYMIEPLPTRVANTADLIVMLENFVRLGLIGFAIHINRKIPKAARASHSMLLVAFFSLNLIWAIGTVNWGTASRHHVPSLMLICIAAFCRPPLKTTPRRLKTPSALPLQPVL